ncbi:MAG: hypothetical protein LKJ88_02335 [Bacilli bacterium]|jgi:hypothetical protein|nr:hypothetical protein [Bacilli bacterium]
MAELRKLNAEEMEETKGGEAITLAGVLAVLAIAIVVVVCYRLFVAPKGKVTLPGGYNFEWGGSSK